MNLQKFFDELTEQNPANIHSLVKHVAPELAKMDYPDEVCNAIRSFICYNYLLDWYEKNTAEAWNTIHEYLKAVDRKENL